MLVMLHDLSGWLPGARGLNLRERKIESAGPCDLAERNGCRFSNPLQRFRSARRFLLGADLLCKHFGHAFAIPTRTASPKSLKAVGVYNFVFDNARFGHRVNLRLSAKTALPRYLGQICSPRTC